MNIYLVGTKNPEMRRQVIAQQTAEKNWRMTGFIDNNPALQGYESISAVRNSSQ